MILPLLAWSAACGAALALGAWAIAGGLRVPAARLGDALALLSSEGGGPSPSSGGEEDWGGRVRGMLPVPVSPGQHRALAMRGMTVESFFAEKAVWSLVGLCLPAVVGTAFSLLVGVAWLVPVGAALVGGVMGFFVPDLLLLRGAAPAREDAGEALLTFLDLVTLERLANQSATQALHSAAGLSDSPLFRRLRAALERARLEQRPPYTELRQLADELDLPELADVADVMRLDEQGASLTGALRARVRELRDAHLTRAVMAAQEVSERMTLVMVLPALVFGLMFLVPPLLRLVR